MPVITPLLFDTLILSLGVDVSEEKAVAVAVSGGGDSLALSLLLDDWCKKHGVTLHALTVDHGLRPESAQEANYVATLLKPLGITHKILKWTGEKPLSRLQESARHARYDLMARYCKRHKIKSLFVAHHGDDQMETILFRMAKGTGIDGLAGMRPVQSMENGLTLLRPLLSVSHDDLLDTLRDRGVEWVEDPSNHKPDYARVRIRKTIDGLKAEGLTSARIQKLSQRLMGSLALIDTLINDAYQKILIVEKGDSITLSYPSFLALPFEGRVHLLKKIFVQLTNVQNHAVRLEDIERLANRMNKNFRGATLGGCQFTRRKESLFIAPEVYERCKNA